MDSFKESGWQIKPGSFFEQYSDDGQQDKLIYLSAFADKEFESYVTLK